MFPDHARSGSDGINFDTVGASGDADFLAALKSVEKLKRLSRYKGRNGDVGEFVLGMHGDLEYEENRLAGLYPHLQVKLAEKAGVDLFGPVVNTKSNKLFPGIFHALCTLSKLVPKQPISPFIPTPAWCRRGSCYQHCSC